MGLRYFLPERTAIIRTLYDLGRVGLDARMAAIDQKGPPFDVLPPFNPEVDDPSEPPFLEDWLRASQATEVLGMVSVSLLADSFRRYFELFREDIGFVFVDKKTFKAGFVRPYQEALAEIFGAKFEDCPVRFDLIEQVVLARNSIHHGQEGATFRMQYDRSILEKFPNPFFVDELDEGKNPASFWWGGPTIQVTRENLFTALDEADNLARWIDDHYELAYEWKRALHRRHE